MNKNKIIIYATLVAVLCLIAIPSTYKVTKKHQERLLKYTTKKIIETAKDCYYNNSCVENKITLAELYEKNGLTMMYNPITKEVYDENSYVDVLNNFNFVDVKE